MVLTEINKQLSRDREGAGRKQKFARADIFEGYVRKVHETKEYDLYLQVSTEQAKADRFSGDDSERVPPDPIPNSEVKTFSADDSVIYSCESRTLPEFKQLKALADISEGFFIFRAYLGRMN